MTNPKFILIFAVLLGACAQADDLWPPFDPYAFAVAHWNFEDGINSTVAADISGFLPADGILSGGAMVVADPLGVRGQVLYVPEGGRMTTDPLGEPKMDGKEYAAVSFWAYLPWDNAWWDLTLGKGGNGSPRFFLNTHDTDHYMFAFATLQRPNGSLFDLSTGAWYSPISLEDRDQWYHFGAQVYPIGGGHMALRIFMNGQPIDEVDTASLLEQAGSKIVLTDQIFEVAPNANWNGYVDDLAIWNGYGDDDFWADLYAYGLPEPTGVTLMSLGGAVVLRRKARWDIQRREKRQNPTKASNSCITQPAH